jgi:hypothetical protein
MNDQPAENLELLFAFEVWATPRGYDLSRGATEYRLS